jgi:predicted phage terminase large subunit-like protein
MGIVTSLLKEISYQEVENYVPSNFALKFVNFIKLVNGEQGEQNVTPVFHYKMLDLLASRETHIANMIFRGSGKSTVWGEYLFLYLAVYNALPFLDPVRLAIYISDSIDNGIKNMRKNLEFRWENSEFLQQYVPKAKFIENRWEFENIDGIRFIVKGYGSTQGIRGVKEMGVRPTLAVADDIIGDDDARSPTVIANIEDTVHKAVEHALHPTKRKFLWLGTPFNQRDPLYKVIDSGAWKSNVFPICEQFPCKKKDFRGAWEDRFPYSFVRGQYNKAKKLGKLDAFNQELMLQIMSDDERLVQDKDIRWYKRRKVIDNIGAFNVYITTDFATSDTQASDWSVINVWALNNVGSWYWIDGFYDKVLLNKTMEQLFSLAQRWKPQGVAVEVSGQQKGFVSWIYAQMMDKNIYFTLSTAIGSSQIGIRPTKDKMSRFQTNAVPLFKAGKMFFPEEFRTSRELEELLAELSMATVKGFKSKHDDQIDTITQLGEINIWRPSEVSVADDANSDTADFIWEHDISDDSENSSYFV